jgi:hypothetical protein
MLLESSRKMSGRMAPSFAIFRLFSSEAIGREREIRKTPEARVSCTLHRFSTNNNNNNNSNDSLMSMLIIPTQVTIHREIPERCGGVQLQLGKRRFEQVDERRYAVLVGNCLLILLYITIIVSIPVIV